MKVKLLWEERCWFLLKLPNVLLDQRYNQSRLMSIASMYAYWSMSMQVILCTDGLANRGIGSLDGM